MRQTKAGSILKHLPRLSPIDLSDCGDVNDIVTAMEKCSFGARMLGEAAATLTRWFSAKDRPVMVCTESPTSPVGRMATKFKRRGWVSIVQPSHSYALSAPKGGRLVVVGPYEPWFQQVIDERPDQVLCINPFEMARTGQITDGYFPEHVSTPADFSLPILAEVVESRLGGKKGTRLSEFLQSIRHFGPNAMEVYRGLKTVVKMVSAKRRGECSVFLTLAGAMTPAQMGLVIDDLIAGGYVDHVTSTGALMAHGLIQGVGLTHYAYKPEISDLILAKTGLNRVTDSLEPESNFSHIERIVDEVLNSLPTGAHISTGEFHRLIGHYLAKRYRETRAILKSAFLRGIPVVTPAFVDSELGNDLICHNLRRVERGEAPIVVNPELDSLEAIAMVSEARKTGIISVGGGTPRNNRQNDCPLIEAINERVGDRYRQRMFSYGVRIDPAAMTLGNLGGCRYSENLSWRKFRPDAQTAEIRMDATVVLPFLAKALMEQVEPL